MNISINNESILSNTSKIVSEKIAPIVNKIDRDGLYPEDALRSLGKAGAYVGHLRSVREDNETDMGLTIQAMSKVSYECLSSGFATWCQDTCAWYVQNSTNPSLIEMWLPKLASGEVLGGTGMSNTMKAFSGIEDLRLKGRRVEGGYVVNGTLPWVSNLGENHVFGTLFGIEGAQNKSVMALIDCSSEGFSLRMSAHFTALEGTRTYACIFENVFVPDEMIIDHDGGDFLHRTRSGIVLLQMGMGIGNIQSCIDIARDSDNLVGHVNAYLDDRPDQLQEELDAIVEAGLALAEDPYEHDDDFHREILQVRLSAGELALRASQSAMLHSGAKGYLDSSPAQRKLRESYFVAIVTPATKHLRKVLASSQLAQAA
jgi:alkylation response protein AidB-like acyl-CoA dehydrogenase